MIDRALRKYLREYAEVEATGALAGLAADHRYGHVLCIPARGEGEDLLRTLASVPRGPLGDVLIIVVVNESASSPEWVREGNQVTLAALCDSPRPHRVVIDRTRTGVVLPKGQGVGLARKIAADVALGAWAAGRIESPWIHCSDADVVFPGDYFSRPLAALGGGDPAPAAFVYDFRHLLEPDPATARAALRYEIFLRYYVLGLRSAGSRYAFHTIGSTLALSPLAYARARGFPRRNAAEDFHLLAKLAKLGPIETLRGEPLLLSGRVSTRVPFGTGAGIAKELERIATGAFYPAYDPRIFTWLRVWLRTLETLADPCVSKDVDARGCLAEHAAEAPDVDASRLYDCLDGLGAIRAAEHGRERGARHLHERFDALRTLRLIHILRDEVFPSLPLETAIREASFLGQCGGGDLVAARDALARAEAGEVITL